MPILAGWIANKPVAEAGGPISLNNFRGAYERGGIVPAGGAEIEITSVPNPSNLTGYIRTELKGAGPGPFEEAVENGKPGIRVTYTETLASDIRLVTVAFYLPRGSILYKFYLTYRVGNKSEQDLRLLFSTVIAGAQLR